MKMLVVVDMQKDFITGALANENAQAMVWYVKKMIREAKEEGCAIVFTMDTHGADYMDTIEGRKLPVPHCIKGTDGWQIIDELDAFENASEIFEKGTFGSERLANYIGENREFLESITFVGVCTDICVISNAMAAKMMAPDVPICVDAAGCAGVTPESHDTALAAMTACHIDVINQGEEAWRK